MQSFLNFLHACLWSAPVIIFIVGTGVFLTIYYRFFQFRRFGEIVRCSFKKGENGGAVSPFASLCTFLSAAMGTGNIIGVAVCMKEGGAGAPVWMTISALFTSAICFSESFLAIKHREKGTGPMAYLRHRKVYAAIGLLSAILGMGTLLGVNSVLTGVENFTREINLTLPHLKVFVGGIVALLVFIIISGGLKRISSLCEKMIPFLTILYILGCGFILVKNRANVIPSVVYMLKSAFNPEAVAYGISGGLFLVMGKGIAMGIFTNEAGIGTSGIALCQAGESSSVSGGFSGVFGVFVDTVVVCNITALSIMSSGAYFKDLSGWEMTNFAFQTGFSFCPFLGTAILSFCLVIFAFAAIIGWSFYGEVFWREVFSSFDVKGYRFLFSLALFLGVFSEKEGLFCLPDIFNALMTIPNVIRIILCRREVREELIKIRI